MKSVSYNTALPVRSEHLDACVVPLNSFSCRFQVQCTQNFHLFKIFNKKKYKNCHRKIFQCNTLQQNASVSLGVLEKNLSFEWMNKLNNIFVLERSMKFYFIGHFDFLMLLYQKCLWNNFSSVNQFAIFDEFITLCEPTLAKKFSSAICGLKIRFTQHRLDFYLPHLCHL